MAYSQDKYLVNGKVLIANYDFRRVKVVLTDGNFTGELEVSDKGVFTAELNWNKTYFFKFSKPGYVSKIIEFSTFVPQGRSRSIRPFAMGVRLFPVFEGVDSVFFRKPVAKVYYDDKLSDFTDDRDYALEVVYRIKQMLKKSRKIAYNNINAQKDKLPDHRKNLGAKNIQGSGSPKNVKSYVSRSVKAVSQKSTNEIKSSYDLIPLKKNYPEGRTIESFYLEGKEITRVVINQGGIRDVFFQVKHRWGGVFYFLDEMPLGIFPVTKTSFMWYTGLSSVSHQKVNVAMNSN